jgi:hypothetical protein
MNLTQIYLDENAKIEVDTTLNYLQVTFLNQPCSINFKKIKALALKYALDHKLTLWLCDMQEVLYLSYNDQTWLVREVFEALNTNFKHEIAYVVNTQSLELRTTFRLHDLVKNSPELNKLLKVEIFFETEIAQQWLLDPVKLL